MREVLLAPIGLQLLLPTGLPILLWLRRHPSRAAWMLAVISVAAVIMGRTRAVCPNFLRQHVPAGLTEPVTRES